MVQSSTPHSIVNFDGSLDDWPQDSHLSTDNGLDFHMTWNETHLFFGLEGTETFDLSSFGYDEDKFKCASNLLTSNSNL